MRREEMKEQLIYLLFLLFYKMCSKWPPPLPYSWGQNSALSKEDALKHLKILGEFYISLMDIESDNHSSSLVSPVLV
jgi:hypothetical protein